MLAAFSVTPLGAERSSGEGSVAGQVAKCVRIVRDSGLPNETTSMFTTIEGDWDSVMTVVKQCVDSVLAAAPRASVTMKLDCRPGHSGMLASKVEAVEQILSSDETNAGRSS